MNRLPAVAWPVLLLLAACSGAPATSPDLGNGGREAGPAGEQRLAADGAAAIDCPECLVFSGGKIFDGDTVRPALLVVQGERILRVLPATTPVRAGQLIQLGGKVVLPGLADLHLHADNGGGPRGWAAPTPGYLETFKALLRSGVTTALDLGASGRTIFGYRERLRSAALLGPGLFAAGPMLTHSGGHPCYAGEPVSGLCVLIDSPADAGKLAKDLFPFQPDLVKVILESGSAQSPLPRLSADSLAAVAQAAQAASYRVIAHVSHAVDVTDSLDRGVRLFAHSPYYDLLGPDLAARMAKEGAVLVPTLVVEDSMVQLALGTFDLDPAKLGDDVPASVLAALGDPKLVDHSSAWQAEAAAMRDTALANFKECMAAGVTIAAGTDSGNPGTFPGLSLVRELELYVEAGMTPVQALRAATSSAADLLGAKDRGRLCEGCLADLLIVDGDPTQQIGDLRQVRAVYRAGKLVDRAALSVKLTTSLVQKPVSGVTEGQLCLTAGECASGLACDLWFSRCLADCQPSKLPQTCSTGSSCFAGVTSSAGSCYPGDACELFAQSCENGAACQWIGNGATLCSAAGKGTAGSPCAAYGAGCAPGFQCNPGSLKCYQLCQPGQLGTCPEGHSCTDLSSYAGLSVGMCS